MAAIPATFKAYEYTHHSQDPIAELQLNPKTTLKPLQPNQVTVKIYSASVNPVDYKLVLFGQRMLPNPATPESPVRMGFDLSGVIVAVGSGDVKGHFVGEEIFAMTNFDGMGSFAEYINVDVKYIAPKPKQLSFNEAAGVPLAGQTSHQALVVYGKLQAGQRVLIIGGSTATGISAIQEAKAIGAYVITTCSARNIELVKSLGADQVVDYTKEKWSEVLEAGSIDLIYDCGMEPNSWNDEAQKVLKKNTGIFVTIEKTRDAIQSPIGATHHQILNEPSAECLSELSKLIEAGKMKVVIDSVHSLEKVHEAIKLQMSSRARGKIIVEVVKP